MKRRSFIKNTVLASTAALAPGFLAGFAGTRAPGRRRGKILIVVQLSGGNDGLNTIVPYRDDVYYRSRPTLAIRREEALSLSDELGLNPVMGALRELYDEGLLSIVNGVGYPNPDRSHFRSMDIWHSASPSDEYWHSGWLGRYLDSRCAGCETPHHALEVDDSLSLALRGERRSGFAAADPRKVARAVQHPVIRQVLAHHEDHAHTHENVSYLYKVLIDTEASADYLYQQTRVHRALSDYPPTEFGRNLRQIVELITADTDTRIYYVSLGGFDTHARQKGQQERLLQQYAEGMKALVGDLRRHDLLQDTLIMTFSEFGRRVAQNASQGTDHGTANQLYLIGGGLRHPGFFNEAPDLARLDEGDLIHQIDFRSVYATVLERWLDADAAAVLGGKFPVLELV